MVSDRLTRATALTGLVMAGVLALGACRSTGESSGTATAASTGSETTAASTASVDTDTTTQAAASGDIVEVASAAGQFTTLVQLIDAAGLTATLQGDGPFTVFAPSDAAFAELPAGTVDALLLPENRTRLAQILSYHVVAGSRLSAADLAGQSSLTTVEGRDLSLSNGKVDNASVITADIDADNGVIHVIDTVLIP